METAEDKTTIINRAILKLEAQLRTVHNDNALLASRLKQLLSDNENLINTNQSLMQNITALREYFSDQPSANDFLCDLAIRLSEQDTPRSVVKCNIKLEEGGKKEMIVILGVELIHAVFNERNTKQLSNGSETEQVNQTAPEANFTFTNSKSNLFV